MIDTLYYMCLYSYLKGSRKYASLYLDMLREEYRSKGTPTVLSEDQYKELKKIRNALSTGLISDKAWVDESPFATDKAEGANSKQDNIVKRIHSEALGDIREILGQPVWLENLEHPCPPHGRVDMLYRSDDTVYPTEVKVRVGEHDLIGQILKYRMYMMLRLHYHLYSHVIPVTICAGYDPLVLRELKAHGVETLVYSDVGECLKVTKT